MFLSFWRTARLLVLVMAMSCLIAVGSVRAQMLTGFEQTESAAPVFPEGRSLTAGVDTSRDAEPVNLDAEKLEHDEATGTVVASGNVFLVQGERILRADEIRYNVKNDTAVASGNVVLSDENGDFHYAERVKFNDQLKNGFVEGLAVYMADGSRFTALRGRRENGVKTTMKDATYTACEGCSSDPDRPPLWRIRASEVVHNQEESSIAYKNARFEVAGVPIAYLPYFTHPDGTIKRKSGVLPPSFGYRSELGAFVKGDYYIALAPDKDATIGLMAMTEQAPLLTGEWRQRWSEAAITLGGGITNSDRVEQDAGVNRQQGDEVRGHILGQGRWDINERWRSGFNVAWASDDQYMRQYDFTNEDVLENEVYAERFSGRHYAAARMLTFQDIRVRERRALDQPEVLPEIVASFVGEPGGVPIIGGRWGLDASFLGLHRGGADQDMNRLSMTGNWARRFVSDTGLLTRVQTDVRGDWYHSTDRLETGPDIGDQSNVTATRHFAKVNMQTSYPLARRFEHSQMAIEPVVGLTVAPNIDVNEDIPNEDSQDALLDVSNIFDSDRFPGLDRIEDQSHVTYGLRTGLYGDQGGTTEFFLGQSHRFQDDDNPFPAGSGLENQNSDIVGQLSALYGRRYNLNYRFQLESDTMASRRHEVDASADWGRFYISSRYLYTRALAGTDIDESREQIRAGAGYYLSPAWRVRTGITQDLGADPGLRKASFGLDYFGQCLSWAVEARRNYTNDASGESDTEIIFNIGLKSLGGYTPSGLRRNLDDD